MQSKLSSEGMMMDVETEEGLARRYSMHFRVKAGNRIKGGGTLYYAVCVKQGCVLLEKIFLYMGR